jgi:hypothetical protein
MNVRHLLPAFVLFLFACGPSASDRANMAEKMTLETDRAKIWTSNVPNCAKLAAESTAFNKANHDKSERLDAWWGKVGKSAKNKLIAENRAAWDAQSNALVQTMMTCPNEIKASLRGQ